MKVFIDGVRIGGVPSSVEEEDIMTTKEQIRTIRAATGLSQVKFANRFGIPARTIEQWEGGFRECPLYVAELLAFAAEHDYRSPRADKD